MDSEIVILDVIAVALSFLTGIVLLSFNRKRNSPQRILAVYFLVIGCGLSCLLAIFNRSVLTMPHFFRTVLISAYAYPPLAYLYVRQNIKPKTSISDIIHFIPALFYIIDFLPFFLLPGSKKLPAIQSSLNNVNIMLAHGEGWLTFPWFHLVFRNLVNLFYWVLSVRILMQFYRVKQNGFFTDNLATIRWLMLFVILQFFFFFPYLFFVIIGKAEYTYYASNIPIIIMAALTSIVLFFKPSVFYGFKGILVDNAVVAAPITQPLQNITTSPVDDLAMAQFINELNIDGEKNPEANLTSQPEKVLSSISNVPSQQLEYLNQQDLEKMQQQVDTFLSDHQPFLQHAYSINDFAKDVGIPSRRLSAYLNHVEQLNYKDFINRHRIGYCLEHLSSKDWQNLTLEGIAGRCGFSNRNSFTNAFKKITGVTPSAFLGKLKKAAA